MTRKFLSVLVVLAFMPMYFFATSSTVHACSCIALSDPTESLNQSDAVFRAKVTNVGSSEDENANISVDLDVSEVWKGDVNQTVSVTTAGNSAACGYNFEEGQDYIVYADALDDGLNVSLCSRTALVTDAVEDLDLLGDGQEPGTTTTDPNTPTSDNDSNSSGGDVVINNSTDDGEEETPTTVADTDEDDDNTLFYALLGAGIALGLLALIALGYLLATRNRKTAVTTQSTQDLPTETTTVTN